MVILRECNYAKNDWKIITASRAVIITMCPNAVICTLICRKKSHLQHSYRYMLVQYWTLEIFNDRTISICRGQIYFKTTLWFIISSQFLKLDFVPITPIDIFSSHAVKQTKLDWLWIENWWRKHKRLTWWWRMRHNVVNLKEKHIRRD